MSGCIPSSRQTHFYWKGGVPAIDRCRAVGQGVVGGSLLRRPIRPRTHFDSNAGGIALALHHRIVGETALYRRSQSYSESGMGASALGHLSSVRTYRPLSMRVKPPTISTLLRRWQGWTPGGLGGYGGGRWVLRRYVYFSLDYSRIGRGLTRLTFSSAVLFSLCWEGAFSAPKIIPSPKKGPC